MKKVFIKNKQGERLSGVWLKNERCKKLVIICHGFLGSKEKPLIKHISEALFKASYDTFRFDFSGNGESEGVLGDAGILKEKNDLVSVIKYFKSYKELILFGTSMGGAVVLTASKASKRIKAVIVHACLVFPAITFKDSIIKFNPFVMASKINKEKLDKKLKNEERMLELEPSVVKKFKYNFYNLLSNTRLNESFFKELTSVDVTDYAESLEIPLFIIHGRKDELIPVSHAEYLYNQNKKYSRLVLINAGHGIITSDNEIRLLVKNVLNCLKELNQKK